MATWKLAQGKTWRGKLEATHPNHGKTVPIPAGMTKRFGKGTMLIPKPLDVDALVRKVRKGKLLTQAHLRTRLACDAGADHTLLEADQGRRRAERQVPRRRPSTCQTTAGGRVRVRPQPRQEAAEGPGFRKVPDKALSGMPRSCRP